MLESNQSRLPYHSLGRMSTEDNYARILSELTSLVTNPLPQPREDEQRGQLRGNLIRADFFSH
jgi:uncharacterized protein YjfI (DUF2170 family)